MATDGTLTRNGSLNRNQRRVLPFLLSYRNIADAANAAGLGKRTVLRWMTEDPEFQAELARLEGYAIDWAARQLVGLADEALQTLHDLMTGDTVSEAVRYKAADAVLRHQLKYREMRDFGERLTLLEEVINRGLFVR